MAATRGWKPSQMERCDPRMDPVPEDKVPGGWHLWPETFAGDPWQKERQGWVNKCRPGCKCGLSEDQLLWRDLLLIEHLRQLEEACSDSESTSNTEHESCV